MLFDTILSQDCIEIDPVLQEIFEVIAKNSDLLDLIYKDLCKGLKNPKTGRLGVNAKQLLGFNLVKFREDLSYRKTRNRISDSLSLRVLLEFGLSKSVPDWSVFQKATRRLSAETVREMNELIIKFAEKNGIETGTKVRTDSTAVDSNIHYPTDNSLMVDVVRVITRNAKKLYGRSQGLIIQGPAIDS